MYLPRNAIAQLYLQLLKTHHQLSPPVLILTALEPDALCACRILTALFKRDYIPHKIQPVAGYGDLARAGEELVQPMQTGNGGSGGVVVCMGVGGLVDLAEILRLDGGGESNDFGGIQVWVIDARRPWNLSNVFGGGSYMSSTSGEESSLTRVERTGIHHGRVSEAYKPSDVGGIIVYDDGDIDEELSKEREAYYQLEEMPEIDEDGSDVEDSGSDSGAEQSASRPKKRKSWSGEDDNEDDANIDLDDGPPRRRRRSNSVRY
jgi:cell division control protein 45